MAPRSLRTALAVFALAFLFGCAHAYNRFTPAEPDRSLSLPADLAAHPDYRTEWWYFTGNLVDEVGDAYSFQLVFFRRGADGDTLLNLVAGAVGDPVHMSHFCLTDYRTGRFDYNERLAKDPAEREGGEGGTDAGYFHVWNGDWSVQEVHGDLLLDAANDLGHLTLVLKPGKPYVRHGAGGYFRKSTQGNASYYISNTRLLAEGKLTIDGTTHTVSGVGWHDHEFGTGMLSEQTLGWDWFSIQLDDDTELMLYGLRFRGGGYEPNSAGSLIDKDGHVTPVSFDDVALEKLRFWKSPSTGAVYPVEWRVQIPRHAIDLHVVARIDDQEAETPRSTQVTYYEGAIEINGRRAGHRVHGFGFLELTGYHEPLYPLYGGPYGNQRIGRELRRERAKGEGE